jgi:membrane fusion protein, adhesin transport system
MNINPNPQADDHAPLASTPAEAHPQAAAAREHPFPVTPPARPARKALAFESISQASRLGEINRASSILLFTIGATFAALVGWAAVSEVDTVASAVGRVIPSARVQLMQSLEGGLVQGIHVVQGQSVEAGTLLVSLSPTLAGGEFETRRQQSLALQARRVRLLAEAEGGEPKFPAELKRESPEFVKVELASFEGRQAEQAMQAVMFEAQIEQRTKEVEEAKIVITTAAQSLAGAREERAIMEKLVAQGLEPRIELVRLDRAISESEGRLASAKAVIPRADQAIVEARARASSTQKQFRTQAREELNRATTDLRALEQGMPALEDRVERTELKAPVRGIVNRVFVNTVGGVAKPGEPLVELVPADDPLVVEAMVNPKDIGFVLVGQIARVKLTAYDYSLFGAMPGKVVQISPDAITNERGESFFTVRVQTDRTMFENLDKKLPIMSGMQAQVDIVTGAKTVLTYLMKPVVAVRESAFRER